MTEEQDVNPPPRKFRRWLKRIALVLGILIALLIIFHRPIIFRATRYFAIRLAKEQNLDLAYQMRGSIFTGLIIESLTATPTGPGPIQKLSVERLHLEYSLPGLISDGLPGFLRRLDLIDTYVELTPGEPTEKPKGPRKAVKFPAIFPAEVRIENLTFISHQKGNDLIVKNLDFILDPTHPGRLAFERLAIPGFRTWENVEAVTTYRERNLRIEKLRLDESVDIALLNLDASNLENSVLGVKLQASLFGGSAHIDATIHDLNASNDLKLDARILSLTLDRVAEYLKMRSPLAGDVRQAHIGFNGPLETPSTWNGQVELNLENPAVGETRLQRVVLETRIADGKAATTLQAVLDPANHLRVEAEASLADDLAKLAQSDISGTITLEAGALTSLPVKNLDIQSGRLEASIPFQLQAGVLKARPQLTVLDFSGYQASLKEATLNFAVEKPLLTGDPPPASPYAGLTYEGQLSGTDIQTSGFVIDALSLAFAGKERQLTVTELDLARGANHIAATASYTLPLKDQKPGDQPLEVKLQVNAPALDQFSTDGELGLSGALQAKADVTHSPPGWQGTISAASDGVTYKNVKLTQIDVRGTIEKNQVDFSAIDLRFDEENFVQGHATVGLETPYNYDANLRVKLPSLSKFAPLLPVAEETGERPELGGSIALDWQGNGSLADLQNEGDLQLSVKNARFGKNRDINATINGHLSPDRIEIPGLTFSSNLATVSTDLLIAEKSLALNNLKVSLTGKAELSGTVKVPLDLRKAGDPAAMLPPDGALLINLSAKKVRLGPLLQKEEGDPAVTGTVNLDITADGTIAAPNLKTRITANGLKFAAAPDLPASNLRADLTLPAEQLTLKTNFEQPGLAPLTIEARYPFSIPEVLEKKAVDLRAPIEARVVLPPSSLSFLSRVSEQVRRADGNVSIDARLSGTIQQPVLSGSARLSLRSLRFGNQNIPPVTDFEANIAFTQEQIVFERFAGALAGGPFSLTGRIGLQPLTNPTFDLTFTAKNTLLTRNETVTARANMDLAVRGDLTSSAVTGKVGITNSRFFREIDILPLQLPGRPAPKPPPAPKGAVVSLPPALKDWTFDVKIVTDDPFLIRGNLASGNVNLDMAFVGKGDSPALDGYAYLGDFVASLPFSQLNIVSGYAYFTPDNPFVPTLDLYGASEIRNYKINVYIYGEASNPETLFSSEPPLPQEDIISLLATGTTTEELTGSSDVAAGRAAALLLQKLSRTIFKNKKPPPPGSFLDRFDFNVGAVDPRTGNQEAEAKYRLTERFYIIGDLDIQGELSGRVKYLIRFR